MVSVIGVAGAEPAFSKTIGEAKKRSSTGKKAPKAGLEIAPRNFQTKSKQELTDVKPCRTDTDGPQNRSRRAVPDVSAPPRGVKQWLDHFAREGDVYSLSAQFQAWLQSNPGATLEVLMWLVKCGLNDSRRAAVVTSVIERLLRGGAFPARAAEECLAIHLPEKAEEFDLEVRPPRVPEFASQLRLVITNSILDAYTDDEESEEEDLDDTTLNTTDFSTAAATSSSADSGSDDTMENDSPQEQQAQVALSEPKLAKTTDTQARPEAVAVKESEKGTLQCSQNSWAAMMKKRRAALENNAAEEHFAREARSLLNKLTVEKFEQLADKLFTLVAESNLPNRGIPLLVQLVFEKATTQHHFITMYVNLCKKMHEWLTLAENVLMTESRCDLKRILLAQCQSSFEQYLEPPAGFDGLAGDELLEAQVKYKTKMLGNIRLVGELIRNDMLARKVGLLIATELLQDDPMVRAEKLETLAVFLEAVGQTLDDRSWGLFDDVEEIFEEIKSIIQDTGVAARIRFLLRDLLDKRKSRWSAQRVKEQQTQSPTTIAKVHQQAAKAHQQPTKVAVQQHAAKITLPSRAAQAKKAHAPSKQQAYAPSKQQALPQPLTPGQQPRRQPLVPGLVKSKEDVNKAKTDMPNASVKDRVSEVLKRFADADKAEPIKKKVPEESRKKVPEEARKRAAEEAKRISEDKQREAARQAHAVAEAKKAPAAPAGIASCEAQVKAFRQEIPQLIRQLNGGLDINSAVQRLCAYPLPVASAKVEIADILARMVDEPKAKRCKLFSFVHALFAKETFAPHAALKEALTSFLQEAFVDPSSLDPPDLDTIVLRELLPALQLNPCTLSLPPCLNKHAEPKRPGRIMGN